MAHMRALLSYATARDLIDLFDRDLVQAALTLLGEGAHAPLASHPSHFDPGRLPGGHDYRPR